MGAIFISYRRDDSEGHAGRLAEDLSERFGRDAVFFDVDTIAQGEDFRRAIDDTVARCLDDPGDFVRLEIAAALRRDIPVVPVLVQGAKMPQAAALPADQSELAYRNAAELSHARRTSNFDLMAHSLAPCVGASSAPR